jgi:hypothetical protein
MFLSCECTLSLDWPVVVLLLCLVCHSMFSNDTFVGSLIILKYNYAAITHVLRK